MRLIPIAALLALPTMALAQPQIPDRPITRKEVAAAAKHQFEAIDANHDGAVTPAEFQAYRARTAGAAPEQPFAHVGGRWFERADANADGRVTLAEALARPLQMFDTADVNHDGVIGASERQMAEMMLSLKGKL